MPVKLKISKSKGNSRVDPLPMLLEIVTRQFSSTSTPEMIAQDCQTLLSFIHQFREDSKYADNFGDSLKALKCSNCQSLPIYLLNCKHFLCNNCFSHQLGDPEQYLSNPLVYLCPMCALKHSPEEMEIIAREVWTNLVATVKALKMQSGIDYQCEFCNETKQKSLFFETSACQNYRACLECWADYYLAGGTSFTCQYGNLHSVPTDLCDRKGVCLGCSQAVYVVGDYLTRICDDHFHCIDCLKKAEASGSCRFCGMPLKQEARDKIKKKLNKTCAQCGEVLESPLFLKKTCCQRNICVFCQSGRKGLCVKCYGCDQLLEAECLEMVLEAQATIEDLRYSSKQK